MNELPKLTAAQAKFVDEYSKSGNASDAYRYAYNSTAGAKTIWVEASRLLKNPKVALWITHMNESKAEVVQEEFKYCARESFNELCNLQTMALEDEKPDYKAFLKAEELKGKLGKCYVEKSEVDLNGKGFSLFYDNLEKKAENLINET